MKKPSTSIIVAAAENNVIGKDNAMLWHIPEDFKYFKKITMGKPCIMGRKTFDSIVAHLGKPLPGRSSIIITRSPEAQSQTEWDEDVIYCSSAEEAAALAKDKTDGETMIIGGAQIYQQALDSNIVDKIYLTRVHQSPDGDAFFPALDKTWQETSRDDHDGYSFTILERR